MKRGYFRCRREEAFWWQIERDIVIRERKYLGIADTALRNSLIFKEYTVF